MSKNQERFHSVNGKRQILIADDEMINRAILGEMLKEDYEVIYAVDGAETLDKMRACRDTLSLVLLDILMPVKSGMDVLREVKNDDQLARIPIIVMTAEKKAEIESLELGAIDFIPKPYPELGVIQARVRRTIELSEDREIIQSTERDQLTGLYNKEYFYRYCRQFDQYHKETEMDAIIVDVNHFHMINERYGKAYGDEVLRKLAESLRRIVQESGGIAGRRNADMFMIYSPRRDDHEALMEEAVSCFLDQGSTENRVRLRMGVYSAVDKNVEMEQRFDRAKMAADMIRGSFAKTVAYYDKNLHERQLYAEQLIEDFPAAIAEKQFQVFYQPKFDVRPDTPVLAGAEALVRWFHPDLGMISPGVFIPLFEENGLIRRLDNYVWEETARQIREWKDCLQYSVPVSVNVSRIDLFDPGLADKLQEILRTYDLTGKDFHLEVTESAYTQDAGRIIEAVENLRALGFLIEMDDFGTGYSSLHMISSLPIDVLKVDMQFIREAFSVGGNTHMLDVIIGIADYLSVPVIAEGVENQDQLHALKQLGCDLVQGYFFSKPVPAVEFEPFILQKKESDLAEAERKKDEEFLSESAEAVMRRMKADALREESLQGPGGGGGTADLAREDRQNGERSGKNNGITGRPGKSAGESDRTGAGNGPAAGQSVKEDADGLPSGERPAIHLRTTTLFVTILAMLAALALLAADISVSHGYRRMEKASDRYIDAQLAASDMESGSDYLTDRVRCFVVTGEIQYLRDFFEEVEVTRRRDKAVQNLEVLLEGTDSTALDNLNTALVLSNELIEVENRAMRLMYEAGHYEDEDVPAGIRNLVLTAEEQELTPEQLKARAQTLVFDNNYMHYKDKIRESVRLCTQSLIRSSSTELEQASAQLALLVQIQTAMTIVFLLIVIFIVVIISQMIRKPLSSMVEKMEAREPVEPIGVEELRFVTRMYNGILHENKVSQERLSHEASHDALTGLFNRGAYDLWMSSADTDHIALILIDVDHFKSVNDNYGHAVGDRVLKRVAEILRQSFRSVDIICRVGGDEFVVVMTRVNSSMRQLVYNKISHANDLLQHPKDDLPPVSLSVGVAFSDRDDPQGDIFKDADTALYRVKDAGRNGCAIY